MDIADLNRRIENIVLHGNIMAVDSGAYRARVKAGNLETNWLPWFVLAAGEDTEWRAPSIGEQVIVLCPSGEPAVGFIFCGFFSNTFVSPSSDPAVRFKKYRDGTVIHYDSNAHKLTAELCEGGSVYLSAPDGVTVLADVYITGDVTVTGDVDITGDVTITGDVDVTGEISATGIITSLTDVIGAGISLVNHRHDNTQPADEGNYSGPPV